MNNILITDICKQLNTIIDLKRLNPDMYCVEESRLEEQLYDLNDNEKQDVFQTIENARRLIPIYPRLYRHLPLSMQQDKVLIENNIFNHIFLYREIPDEFKTDDITLFCLQHDALLFLHVPEEEKNNVDLLAISLNNFASLIEQYQKLANQSPNSDEEQNHLWGIEGVHEEERELFDNLSASLKENLGWLNLSYRQARPLLNQVNRYLEKRAFSQHLDKQLISGTQQVSLPKI
jgi:hypothetical protein